VFLTEPHCHSPPLLPSLTDEELGLPPGDTASFVVAHLLRAGFFSTVRYRCLGVSELSCARRHTMVPRRRLPDTQPDAALVAHAAATSVPLVNLALAPFAWCSSGSCPASFCCPMPFSPIPTPGPYTFARCRLLVEIAIDHPPRVSRESGGQLLPSPANQERLRTIPFKNCVGAGYSG
jgi:hypothetical protein